MTLRDFEAGPLFARSTPRSAGAFKPWLLEQTNGRGVDAVVNSLAGDLLTASVECMAAGGNFCEIGKFDIMENTGLGLRLLERNVSFHVRWDGTAVRVPREYSSGVLARITCSSAFVLSGGSGDIFGCFVRILLVFETVF